MSKSSKTPGKENKPNLKPLGKPKNTKSHSNEEDDFFDDEDNIDNLPDEDHINDVDADDNSVSIEDMDDPDIDFDKSFKGINDDDDDDDF